MIDILLILLGVASLVSPNLVWIVFTRRVDEEPSKLWKVGTQLMGSVILVFYFIQLIQTL